MACLSRVQIRWEKLDSFHLPKVAMVQETEAVLRTIEQRSWLDEQCRSLGVNLHTVRVMEGRQPTVTEKVGVRETVFSFHHPASTIVFSFHHSILHVNFKNIFVKMKAASSLVSMLALSMLIAVSVESAPVPTGQLDILVRGLGDAPLIVLGNYQDGNDNQSGNGNEQTSVSNTNVSGDGNSVTSNSDGSTQSQSQNANQSSGSTGQTSQQQSQQQSQTSNNNQVANSQGAQQQAQQQAKQAQSKATSSQQQAQSQSASSQQPAQSKAGSSQQQAQSQSQSQAQNSNQGQGSSTGQTETQSQSQNSGQSSLQRRCKQWY